ncbi:MAG: hypothetical protein GY711_22915 [bacterium]|nr:hypothetical protein [bacterium]
MAKPPGLADPVLRALLVLVIALQAFAWSRIDGYQLADSVEYMERAQAFVRGEIVIDSQTIRSFGFSSLLAPFFWAAERMGIEDLRGIVWVSRVVQMLMGLLLVRICVRLGFHLGGRVTALAAGAVCAFNPLFLQYSVSPVSDIAAAVCAGHGLEAAVRRGGFRAGVRSGLWLGLALLAAYKTILIFGGVTAAMFLRERWRGRRMWIGLLWGYTLAVVGQIALDKLTYGEWGASFIKYFFSNSAPMIGTFIHDLGFQKVGFAIYNWSVGSVQENPNLRSIQSKTWYIDNLHHMLVWPVLACTLLGVLRSLLEPRWRALLPLIVFACAVAAMQYKGSKDFRLWIPLLPILAPLAGYGVSAVYGDHSRAKAVRRLAAYALLASTLVLGLRELTSGEKRQFAAYWDAIDWVNAEALERRTDDPDDDANWELPRVASAYHWAVFLQDSKDVEIVKLPRQLDGWTDLLPGEQNRDLLRILDMDWLIVHLPVLASPGHAELAEVVSDGFHVVACFFPGNSSSARREPSESLGPVLVLERRTGAEGERGLIDLGRHVATNDPAAYSAAAGFDAPLRLERPDLGEELWLLGHELRQLAGDGHALLTYHYFVQSQLVAKYASVDRLTIRDGTRAWEQRHPPAFGAVPTNEWPVHGIVRVSWPVIAAQETERAGYRPIGGPWRRGETMPGELWHLLATFDASGVTGALEPAPRPAGDRVAVSEDGLARVGRVLVPVARPARLADDGRPLPAQER